MKILFIKILFFIVVVHDALGQRRYNPCNDVPGGNGFVNDLSSCEGYYSCINYLAFAVSCPAPFHFLSTGPGTGICHYADITNCQRCPASGVYMFHKAGSCTDYTLCVDGVAFDQTCGAGQSFSRQFGHCVNAAEVDCVHDIPSLPNLPSF